MSAMFHGHIFILKKKIKTNENFYSKIVASFSVSSAIVYIIHRVDSRFVPSQ